MYEYQVKGQPDAVLRFETAPNAFYPTETSKLLIEACRTNITVPEKTLDLGCGIGITGLVIARQGLCAQPLFASDISADAVRLMETNARNLGVRSVVRCGSLYEPWAGERFDVIIDDVSGISDDVARITPWFPPGVTCEAGRDGTRWITQVLEQAPSHLNKGGKIFFPVLSLSDEERILSVARRHFSRVENLLEREWFLPKETAQKIDEIMPLIEKGTISCKFKFGAWIWSTKIFMAC